MATTRAGALSGVPSRRRNAAVCLACAAALGVAMCVAGRGDPAAPWPAELPLVAKVAANIFLLIDSLPALALLWLGAAGYGYPIRRGLLREAPCGGMIQA